MSQNIDYITNYNKENYKMYQFRVKKTDEELIGKLDSVQNKNQYITSLIKEDIHPGILTIREIKERMLPIIKKHGIEDVFLFGSYARGEATENSDVDIYCSNGDIDSLLKEVDLVGELETALSRKVDVVFIGSQMHPFFKEQVEKDKIKLW